MPLNLYRRHFRHQGRCAGRHTPDSQTYQSELRPKLSSPCANAGDQKQGEPEGKSQGNQPSPATGFAQVPEGLSGTWNVTTSFGNAQQQDQIDLVMMLHQNGTEITGSVGPSADRQVLTISNDEVEGNAASFDLDNKQVKISVQFQLHGGKAEGRFRTSNQHGITIEGTGSGQSPGESDDL